MAEFKTKLHQVLAPSLLKSFLTVRLTLTDCNLQGLIYTEIFTVNTRSIENSRIDLSSYWNNRIKKQLSDVFELVFFI